LIFSASCLASIAALASGVSFEFRFIYWAITRDSSRPSLSITFEC